MKYYRSALFLLLFPCLAAISQNLDKTVQDAYLISRMAERFHVDPRPLDAALSAVIFASLMEDLDDQHLFFTKQDYDKLSVYRNKLDEEIRNRKSDFLRLLIDIYKQRINEADSLIGLITKIPFNFSVRETYTAAEDSSFADGLPGLRSKWTKIIKLSVLTGIVNRLDTSNQSALPGKKQLDSLEPILRKKANRAFKRMMSRLIQSPQGIEYILGNLYCESVANAYDPHSSYFPPDIKTAFESELGNKPSEFGFSLKQDADGNVAIGKLKPGGPAFQSGRLNEGDKILSIQWENKEAIDVSDAWVEEVSRMLQTSGADKVTITVKKSDGTSRSVPLRKAKAVSADAEEDKVKGFLIKGSKNVGYVSLPDFYTDWEDSHGLNGCANDVAREIIKLKKENIDGLILDLRFNGGGSIDEAVELAGIFIDAGPVGQIKSRDSKAITLKDVNRGTIYDGPLLLLVNGSSASASEFVAAALQDYNRALIVGSPTYGKATAQVVLPMDTSINLNTVSPKTEASSYIKLTISRLYRITGKTAQFNGIIPDIDLPEPINDETQREASERNALQPTVIDANKYYKPLAPLPVAAAKSAAEKEIASSKYFRALLDYNRRVKELKQHTDRPLWLEAAWKQDPEDNAREQLLKSMDDSTVRADFKILNHGFESKRIAGDQSLRESNEESRETLQTDPYIKVAYEAILAMIK